MIHFLTPLLIESCTGIPEAEIQPELISRIKDNPELIRSLTPETIKSFTGIVNIQDHYKDI
ncbi:hypothetical protein IQ231_00810 [Cuspidothrix issatschenkoi LEGE 03284]|uniref:hypothetical protein n=1 Tax=Cuspidothrix issatschenkoi TaxID=230752 RepID=UPI0018828698|nr:hypothetical protein [Cuspidothrix issatschenkoi]MBE9230274.1 hypothetical protein [Cuspidothrix issatschenkoi LEGE 03284]